MIDSEFFTMMASIKANQEKPRPSDLEVANSLLLEIIEKYQNARRDEGAFPRGDRRAGISEHRLWLAVQAAKSWLTPVDR